MQRLTLNLTLRLTFFILALVVMSGTLTVAKTRYREKQSATASPVSIYFNGERLDDEAPALNRSGVVFVPLTDTLSFALDADITTTTVSGKTVVTFRTSENEQVFTEGQTLFTVGGAQAELRGAPFAHNGYLAVPARELLSNIGYKIYWLENAIMSVTRDGDTTAVYESLPDSVMIEKLPFPDQLPLPGIAPDAPADTPEAPGSTEPADTTSNENADIFSDLDAGPSIGFTWENTLEFSNIAVSGISSQSSLTPESDFYNKFNLKAEGTLNGGMQVKFNLLTSETTRKDRNQGEVNRLTASLASEKTTLSFYDLNPKLSRYTMKNYQIQGISYGRVLGNGIDWSLHLGKSPKKLRDSRYNRYVRAGRLQKKFSDTAMLGISFAHVKDRGTAQATSRFDNHALALNGTYAIDAWKLGGEVAMSRNRISTSAATTGKARWLNARYKQGGLQINAVYERTGSGFVSESASFTRGRREMTLLANKKLNKRSTAGIGYKSVRLLGETTEYIPIQYNVAPFKERPKLRISMNLNRDESRGASGTRLTMRRQMRLDDRFGAAKVRLQLDRRAQKDTAGAWTYRTSQSYRLNTPVFPKLEATLQYKKEYRTQSTNPRKRQMQSRFTYELAETAELSIGFDRYYLGTTSNRTNTSLGYMMKDLVNDTEIRFEYKYYNYRDHNDNALRMMYRISR